jgi:hypothetical protein
VGRDNRAKATSIAQAHCVPAHNKAVNSGKRSAHVERIDYRQCVNIKKASVGSVEPSSDEIVEAWHRCSPWLTRETAAKSLASWLKLGCLEPVRTETGEWSFHLKEI